MMYTHTAINGRVLVCDLSAGERRFLDRVVSACEDESTTTAELRALIYGDQNPWMESNAEYSFLPPAALDHPAHRVLLDQLDRKRLQRGELDLDKVAARYTMTVAEAAERLGIRDSAVRTALVEDRLPFWKKAEQIYLDPKAVEYHAKRRQGRRGPPPQLLVTCGTDARGSFKVEIIGGQAEPTITHSVDSVFDGKIERWHRVAVIAHPLVGGRREPARFWMVTPGGASRRVESGGFKVAGRFEIVDEKGGKAAERAWEQAVAEARESRSRP